MNPIKNIDVYFKNLVNICEIRGLTLRPIGTTGRKHIWIIQNDHSHEEDKRDFLIVAGMHGDEIAGPLGVLKFLQTVSDSTIRSDNLSIIPIVSPIAFGKRHNSYTRTNCGFVSGTEDKLSIEGKALMGKWDFIKRISKDGFLSLHETIDEKYFYSYAYPTDRSGFETIEDIRNIGKYFFEEMPNGTKIEEGSMSRTVVNGTVYNMTDGSMEHRLSLDGCRLCIVTETPGKYPLKIRTAANAMIIREFIERRTE